MNEREKNDEINAEVLVSRRQLF